MSGRVVHPAGQVAQYGSHLRQRCSWCGAVLLDTDLSTINVMVDPGNPGAAVDYPTWEVGALVATDGAAQYVVELLEGRPPLDSCLVLDPVVTA